jgi:hypothetical protein
MARTCAKTPFFMRITPVAHRVVVVPAHSDTAHRVERAAANMVGRRNSRGCLAVLGVELDDVVARAHVFHEAHSPGSAGGPRRACGVWELPGDA